MTHYLLPPGTPWCPSGRRAPGHVGTDPSRCPACAPPPEEPPVVELEVPPPKAMPAPGHVRTDPSRCPACAPPPEEPPVVEPEAPPPPAPPPKFRRRRAPEMLARLGVRVDRTWKAAGRWNIEGVRGETVERASGETKGEALWCLLALHQAALLSRRQRAAA